MAVSVTRKAASTVRNQCTGRLNRTLVSANTHTRNSTTAAAVSNHTTSILRLVSVSAYRHMMLCCMLATQNSATGVRRDAYAHKMVAYSAKMTHSEPRQSKMALSTVPASPLLLTSMESVSVSNIVKLSITLVSVFKKTIFFRME